MNKTLLMDNLDELTTNRYEAVLAAAKRARLINNQRLAQLEMLTEDSYMVIDYRKVTSIAIEDLLDGKFKYSYPK